jgi:hypothetical protein
MKLAESIWPVSASYWQRSHSAWPTPWAMPPCVCPRLGAVVMARAVDQIIDKGARVAAWLLEAAPADVELSGRRFRVKGTTLHLSRVFGL